jgi:hypothetical protein
VGWGTATGAGTIEFAQGYVESNTYSGSAGNPSWVRAAPAGASPQIDVYISPIKVLSGDSSAFVRLVNVPADSSSRWSGATGGGAYGARTLGSVLDGIGCASGWQKVSCSGTEVAWSVTYEHNNGFLGSSMPGFFPHQTACVTNSFNTQFDANRTPVAAGITCMKIN